jgi:hypothetical protein
MQPNFHKPSIATFRRIIVLGRQSNQSLMLAMAREPKDPSSVPGIDTSATQASMLTRSTLRRPDRPDQDESPKPKGQTRPIEERFLLKVDGQLKRSFGSGEAAKTAGSTIKKAYPVVVVTVVDSQEHITEKIAL